MVASICLIVFIFSVPLGQGSLENNWGGPFRQLFPKFIQEDNFSFDEDHPNNEPLFVTPLLRAGKISQARKAAENQLHSDIKGYSGYFTVNEDQCGSNMFFWYFPAKYGGSKSPTLLWLQGGPGGTSLFGLFNEHGPFKVLKNMTLAARPTSWSLNHNLLYIDNPVGTGYSFTKLDSCYCKDEEEVANDLHDALKQFFFMFPELKKSDFYVTGESYAGKYVPAISYKIHKAKDIKNFKGMAIGDGLCDPETMTDYGTFLFNIGLIDRYDYHYFRNVSNAMKTAIKAKDYVEAFHLFDDLLNGDLSGHKSYFANATGYNYYFNYLITEGPEEFDYMNAYVQLPKVRRAVHVGNMTWNDGKIVERHLLKDIMQSVKPWIAELMDNYRVMIYNGLVDVIIAWPLTENFIHSIKWKGAQKYRMVDRIKWHVGGDLAGYAKQVGNFTQVVVRNAGHMVPYDQPKYAFDLITRFTHGKKFE